MRLLQTKKLQILKPNHPAALGEVDLLARDADTLVLVTVKDRLAPLMSHAKQQKLMLLAHSLQTHYQTLNTRIDIITVDDVTKNPKLRYYKGLIEFHG